MTQKEHDEHIRIIAEEIYRKYECCPICNRTVCDGHYPKDAPECIEGVYQYMQGLREN